MNTTTTERQAAARKRKIRIAAGLFVGMLIVFTLLGNTIQALTLPKVVTAEASSGELAHSFQGSAVLKPQEELELANPSGWKAAKVLVKEGDKVTKGQTLIEYNDSSSKQQLIDEQAALNKLELSMNGLQSNYIEAVKNNDPAAQQAAKTAIDSANIDISVQKQHIAALQDSMEASRRLTAPFDGIITNIHAVEGQPPSGLPDVSLVNAAKGYKFTLAIPSNIADMLNLGEPLDVQTSGADGQVQTVKGKIADMENTQGGDEGGGADANEANTGLDGSTGFSLLTVSLSETGLHQGEQVQVNITKSKEGTGMLIPSTAIRLENNEAYVYTLEEKQGPLGNAYYAVRTPVKIEDASGGTTAVSGGLYEGQPVITDSSGLISDGSRVRI